jgi:ankyrin repeat protein
MVEAAIAQGADVNAKSLYGFNALSLSVRRPAVIRVLLAHGARLNDRDRTGMTPLMCAAMYGNAESVRLLLDAGAAINLTAMTGETAMTLAAKNGYRAVAALIGRAARV